MFNPVGYEMCLMRLETYFSFPNITEINNMVKISIAGKWYNFEIPIGCYNIESINTVIQKELKLAGG